MKPTLIIIAFIVSGLPISWAGMGFPKIGLGRTQAMQARPRQVESVVPATEQPSPAEKAIDEAHRAEIVGKAATEAEIRRFLQIVIFPFVVVMALIMLLRRGIFT